MRREKVFQAVGKSVKETLHVPNMLTSIHWLEYKNQFTLLPSVKIIYEFKIYSDHNDDGAS